MQPCTLTFDHSTFLRATSRGHRTHIADRGCPPLRGHWRWAWDQGCPPSALRPSACSTAGGVQSSTNFRIIDCFQDFRSYYRCPGHFSRKKWVCAACGVSHRWAFCLGRGQLAHLEGRPCTSFSLLTLFFSSLPVLVSFCSSSHRLFLFLLPPPSLRCLSPSVLLSAFPPLQCLPRDEDLFSTSVPRVSFRIQRLVPQTNLSNLGEIFWSTRDCLEQRSGQLSCKQ